MTDYDESVPEQARADRVIEALGREPPSAIERIRNCEIGEMIPRDDFLPTSSGVTRLKIPVLNAKATWRGDGEIPVAQPFSAITFELREAGWVRVD